MSTYHLLSTYLSPIYHLSSIFHLYIYHLSSVFYVSINQSSIIYLFITYLSIYRLCIHLPIYSLSTYLPIWAGAFIATAQEKVETGANISLYLVVPLGMCLVEDELTVCASQHSKPVSLEFWQIPAMAHVLALCCKEASSGTDVANLICLLQGQSCASVLGEGNSLIANVKPFNSWPRDDSV